MTEPCNILLLCDDDLAGLELRGLLGEALDISPLLGRGAPLRIPLKIEELVLSGTWEMGVQGKEYQLCIVAVTGSSPMAELASHPTLRTSIAAILYLVEGDAGASPARTLRAGRDRLLELPCTQADLRHAIEAMLLDVLARRPVPSRDPRYLALLGGLIEHRIRVVEPVLGGAGPRGWRYPRVMGGFGIGVDEADVLERLVEHGLCTRTVALRIRSCPACDSHQLVYGEECARCGSVDFVRETIIHHFACAHMDTQDHFTSAGELVCPKCRVALRQIGRDYEKPTDCYRCRKCAFISSETRIAAHCLACRTRTTPAQTAERVAYAYHLTAKADEAVAAEDLAGHGMASLLRSTTTGLYARTFFTYSLQRELERLRRHGTPVALVVMRSSHLDGLRDDRFTQYRDHVQAMWTAATEGLRTLDIPCVWEEGVLAIMLPATPLAGAEVVAQRIAERFSRTAPALDPRQELVISTMLAGPGHGDAEALVADALATLSPRGGPASDVVVVTDDAALALTDIKA